MHLWHSQSPRAASHYPQGIPGFLPGASQPSSPWQLPGTFFFPPWHPLAFQRTWLSGCPGDATRGGGDGSRDDTNAAVELHVGCSRGAGAITHISSFHTSCTNELFIYCSAVPGALIPSSGMTNISDLHTAERDVCSLPQIWMC